MMIAVGDWKGVIAMMPAFATKNGDSPDGEDTLDIVGLEP
jgi:hypothetical protein